MKTATRNLRGDGISGSGAGAGAGQGTQLFELDVHDAPSESTSSGRADKSVDQLLEEDASYRNHLPWLRMVENTYFRTNWVHVLGDRDAVVRLLMRKNAKD